MKVGKTTLLLVVAVVFAASGTFGLFFAKRNNINLSEETVKSEAGPEEVYVHIKGEVENPGLYILESGNRVNDAIEAAGGATKNADLNKINLAQLISDQKEIYVPSLGKTSTANVFAKEESTADVSKKNESKDKSEDATEGDTTENKNTISSEDENKSGKSVSSKDGKNIGETKINLNTATADELDKIKGIGPVTAAKIIKYRSDHGGRFNNLEELMNIKGIAEKKFQALKNYFYIADKE